MRHKLLRSALVVACLTACAAVPAHAGAVTIGISDNGTTMFSSSYFQSLKLNQARLTVDWNAAVMKDKSALNSAAKWIRQAQDAGISPLIDFEPDPGNAGNFIPSVKQYTRAVKAFIHHFPSITQYAAWNEPDFVYRKLSREPALAAAYFNALHQVCHGCTLVAGELYQTGNQLARWIKAYKKALRYRPAAWGLHPYDDVQSHTANQIKVMMKLVSGPIWLTEISGLVRRGHWHGHNLNQSLDKQASDEAYLFSLPTNFPRITRIYHYEWQADATPWDSALLNPDGSPRPAYDVVAKAASSGS